jgi:hypothetical protein
MSLLRAHIEQERVKAASSIDDKSYHLRNVRLSLRIVEAFGRREDNYFSQPK